jgi:cytochrome c oxidase assembly protein subunit 11
MQDKRNHKPLLYKLLFAVFCMFLFAFALVPLYDTFCEVTGINGKTGGRIRAAAEEIDTSRIVRLEFMTRNNKNMPWEFYVSVPYIDLHPGEVKQVDFYAHNPTEQDMVGQTIPSVSPGLGARYIKKTECFCFDRQPLKAGEEELMPVVLYLDPKIPDDITELTLSYTLFDITDRS